MGFSNCDTPRRWSNSEVELLRVATADIALAIERRQAEASLQQAEAKYRSIFENAVEGIFQTTLAGQFTTVNPMLAKLLRLSISRSVDSWYHRHWPNSFTLTPPPQLSPAVYGANSRRGGRSRLRG